MNNDLLVGLYSQNFSEKYAKNDIQIVRVLSPNSDKVINYVETNFTKGWASEIKSALYQPNPNVFIAVKNNEILGFAAYDATAKNYFGPIGVSPEVRGLNVGKALLLHCLEAMYYDGYCYAIIGGVSDRVLEFYQKSCGAVRISVNGNAYNRLIRG